MTKSRYKELRKQKNFLFLYYIELTGSTMTNVQFNVLFRMWLDTFGMDHQQYVRQIIDFLDKKLG